MTEPTIDDQSGRIHQRALELQDEVVALDTAAHNLDLAFPDRHQLPDPRPDLHPRVAEADEALTRYKLIVSQHQALAVSIGELQAAERRVVDADAVHRAARTPPQQHS